MGMFTEEYMRKRARQIRFDNLGYFRVYPGYWLREDRIIQRYSLRKGNDHPHEPDGDHHSHVEYSTDLKYLVDKAKELRIMDLKAELVELENNDQFDF